MNQQAGQQQLVQPGAGSYVLPPRLDLREELERSRQEGDVASTKQSAKKGEPWTEEEHRAFLTGLQRLGKGQWKQIARLYVPSRTATQVASHAQKHFLRASGQAKRRSRFSAIEEDAAERSKAVTAAAAAGGGGLAWQPLVLPGGPGAAAPVMGRPVTNITLGVPVGMPGPWLPPPIHQPGAAELPILPVGPQPAAALSPTSSRGSHGTASPPPGQPQLHVPQPLPPPSSRQQQLFRLLEMREAAQQAQLAQQARQGGGAAAAGQQQQAQVPTPPLARPAHSPFQLRPPHPFQPRPASSTVSSASAVTPLANPYGARRPTWPGASEAAHAPQQAQQPQLTQQPLPTQQQQQQQEPPLMQAPAQQQQPQKRPRLAPAAWGSLPEGLAMLAEAAAVSGKGGSGDKLGPEQSGSGAEEVDSDADTTIERHTV